MAKKTINKHIIQNSIGTTFYLFCQWLITVLAVKIMNYETAGVLSLAMSVTTTFSTISLYGMRQFQISDYNNKYSSSQYVTSRYLTVLISLALCFFFSIIERYNNYQILCINAFMFFKIVEALIDVYHGVDQKAWRFDIICNSYLLRGLLTFIAYVCTLILTRNLFVSIISMASVSLLCMLLYDRPQSKKLEPIHFELENKIPVLKLLFECLPLVFVSFISTAVVFIPRNTLSLTFGDQQLGIYASVATPAVIVQVLASVIFSPLLPLFSKYDAESNIIAFNKLLFKTFSLIAGIAILSNIMAVLFGKPVLVLLFGASIEQYCYLLLPVVWCTVLTAVIWFLIGILTALRRLKSLFFCMIIGIGVCIFTSGDLIHKYNMNGVSFSTLLSLSVQILMMAAVLAVYIVKQRRVIKYNRK